MDQNFFVIVLLTIILLFCLYIFDEGALLILYGISVILIAFKFTFLFDVIDTDIITFFRMIYAFIGIFAIGKSMYMRKEILQSGSD